MITPPSEHPAVTAVRQGHAAKVKVAVSDIDGILRGKYLHKDKFFGAAEPHPGGGFGFCDVVFGWDAHDLCYDNTKETGWHHGFPDALARLDLATAPDCGDAWGEADAAHAWGQAFVALGEPDHARRAFTQALAVRERIRHPRAQATRDALARLAT